MTTTNAGALPPRADAGVRSGADLLFTGEVFCDLVFTGVDHPEIGAEVYADSFTITPGGAANRAVAAARLGARTLLLSRLGDDPIGAHVRALLDAERELDTALLEHLPGHQSPVSIAITGPHDRSFITYQERMPRLELPETVGPIRAAHVGVAEPLPGWAARLRAAGTVLVGGVGWDDSGAWSPEVLDRLAEVDVFVPNEGEAVRYTRTDDAVAAARALAERVPLAVVTRGPDGVIAVDSANGVEISVPAPRVTAVDPTGAGDVFVAAFMATGLTDAGLESRLRTAALAAALSVTGVGGAASAPRPADLARADPDGGHARTLPPPHSTHPDLPNRTERRPS